MNSFISFSFCFDEYLKFDGIYFKLSYKLKLNIINFFFRHPIKEEENIEENDEENDEEFETKVGSESACNICPKKFDSNDELTNHIKSAHKKLNKCVTCHETFYKAADLYNHLKTHSKKGRSIHFEEFTRGGGGTFKDFFLIKPNSIVFPALKTFYPIFISSNFSIKIIFYKHVERGGGIFHKNIYL